MSAVDLLGAIAGGAATGGVLGAGVTAYVAAKKTPAEVDSIVVDSAEQSVQAALAVARAEANRADREAARADRAEAKVEHLLSQLEQAQALINHIRNELYELKNNN